MRGMLSSPIPVFPLKILALQNVYGNTGMGEDNIHVLFPSLRKSAKLYNNCY